ncbi:MAG TPA: protein kinase [Terriglobia bacterium]|nr:protein kinase [Terriglobia bacterium]
MSEEQRPADVRRQRQINDIYLQAVELETAARGEFVHDACKDDPDLLQRVKSLLAWHERMDAILDEGAMSAAVAMGQAEDWPAGSTSASNISEEGRLGVPNHVPGARFAPGVILCDRYRIVGLVGRGGMGEVYRADDLRLGQAVALKFLAAEFASDPVRRERLFAEVRIARQLSHPNITRVYDVGEFEGRPFLSMEYIDGENLASLLTRIGYLSNEKAIDIARQLLAGLAAAHERGVLHRDLKPANIMLDGRGRVRITDFGIAVAAGEDAERNAVLGTPAYMAPEQFNGSAATVRTDIYGLGLVLYEVYCGRKAFTASSLAELRDQKEYMSPRAPSEIRTGMDPVVESVIVRCMDRDPQTRPGSVAELLLSLPGGDPLAAAIAAGETPLPEMVAASRLREDTRSTTAVALLIVVILGSFAIILMNPRASLLLRSPQGKDPRVLVDRAQEFIHKAGYTYTPADMASGLDYDAEFLDHVRGTRNTPDRWDATTVYSPVIFWFRQSARPLEHLPARRDQSVAATGVRPDDPPLQFPGDVLLRSDVEGRLRRFTAVPWSTGDSGEGDTAPAEWPLLFAAAGLDPSDWSPTEPDSVPNYFADTRAAWTGVIPGVGSARIEAASYRGRPVSFEIVEPWRRPQEPPQAHPLSLRVVNGAFLVAVVTALYFARRNLRRGRGDRRGATRLALFTSAVYGVSWIVNEHHVATSWELTLAVRAAAQALFAAATTWVLYIALEPTVRRRYPSLLISWTRVLAGGWRDPRVGRDILAGCALGVTHACLSRFLIVAPAWFGYAEGPLLERDIGYLFATGVSAGRLFDGMLFGVSTALIAVLLYVYLGLLFRSKKIAAVLWVLANVTPVFVGGDVPFLFLPLVILTFAAFLAAMLRFGLLSVVVATFVDYFWTYPISLRISAWYAGLGWIALLAVAAVTIYGFQVSLGGRQPLLRPAEKLDGA